ncbi:Sodium/calcium exchanger protein [Taphrina deformans PYCC 5710]|uniref:Sodium/calcium exchanger protein n=1 Tax=Taphrina deformans (strain PYCC 5710 / ATCC 11124 / CBS 356.35 / IMI 108563 / JCM 9778 / NBRC 8474) TaxID=1097556 RepID=R4XH56_TAPDE|nr:Sodium/calcium exchanger protein [Taphrina deformans PYCC 5710]|eukprot:CCG85183.1 Sodium/calcium exchanger protein [Taphrina deformans PYCC 5710]
MHVLRSVLVACVLALAHAASFQLQHSVGDDASNLANFELEPTIGVNTNVTVLTTKTPKHHCEHIHQSKDPCKYARKYCSPESAGMVDYIAWYYCDMKDAQPVAFTVIVLWTALLFSTIGIASSDFFCPNLATIANSLGMSQSVAGATFLAFGNGSPDVFSTFAAFKAHSGSLAIGELLGAAAFITSVVAGAMAIIAPFKVARRPFLRDAGFFLVAVIMTMVLLADGKLRLWESILMIVFYVLYVAYVLIGTFFNSKSNKKKIIDSRIRSQYAAPGQASSNVDHDDLDEESNRLLAEDEQDIANIEGSDSDDDSVEHDFQDLNSSMSITGRPMHTSKNSVRPSLLGALEFRELVTGLAEDGSISPTALKTIKNRPRSHSSAVQAVGGAKRPVSTTNRTYSAKALRQDLSENAFLHQHNHIHKRAHTADNTDRVVTSQNRPIIMSSRSNSSSRSDVRLNTDEIASNSLRAQNPIELLSPNVIAESGETMRTNNVPSITINSAALETDQFAKPWSSGSDEGSTKAPSYEATTNAQTAQRINTDAAPGSSNGNEEGLDDGPWVPSWWPERFLPNPANLKNLLFPTLLDFQQQSYTQRLLSILATPSVFVLTITLPVVNPPINEVEAVHNQEGDDLEATIAKDDAERYTAHRGWNRWLTCLQCLLTPGLVAYIFFSGEPLLLPMLGALIFSLAMLALVLLVTRSDKRPRFHSWFCFLGFTISVCWISTIANEVVGTLQAFGTILGLSDAILGLTVFAVGNSLGDFVADVTVARMGFSQMAISGVFGGPMLNILIGIGISGIYINISKHHVYNTEISPTLIVSGASLLTTLIILLIAVPANGYVMTRKLGVALCCIFLVGMITSVLVEIYMQS